jgi:hypothetical protein
VWWDFAEWQKALLASWGVPEQAFDSGFAIGVHLEDPLFQVADLLTTGHTPPR